MGLHYTQMDDGPLLMSYNEVLPIKLMLYFDHCNVWASTFCISIIRIPIPVARKLGQPVLVHTTVRTPMIKA
jgi:hypothetical protein